MATMAFSSPHLMMHRLIFRRSTPQFSALASLAYQANQSFPYLKTTPFSNTFSFSTCSLPSFSAPLRSVSQQLENDVVLLENAQTEPNVQTESEREPESAAAASASEGLKQSRAGPPPPPPPSLSVKEKKDLASYAHSLGKKLKSQQVGKSGVTDTVVMALLETLEANELLKLKIHGTCPGELEDVVKHLEETTGSVAVGQIGRTVILYRPSLTKLKAEEKRKQAQRVYLKRQSTPRQTPQV
ncbi:hypothetical protein PHJA_000736100 [Phtheirospermum japonicum]|uniref:CRM domain-containing protein n=1 Tax=Phtheirospermum japonicum TaxID=374723 RepID=A0A830BNW3_9LAMI|nr:hypothetical protein PHJA_000736100 [Phtheirospermum japonicum]